MALGGCYQSSDEDGDPEATRPDGWGAAGPPGITHRLVVVRPLRTRHLAGRSSARGPRGALVFPHSSPCCSLGVLHSHAPAGMSAAEPVRAGSVRLRVYLGVDHDGLVHDMADFLSVSPAGLEESHSLVRTDAVSEDPA